MSKIAKIFFLVIILAGAGILILRTGVVNFVAPEEEVEQLPATSVLFVGDMMFDRSIRTIGEKEGYSYLLSCIKDVLIEQTIVVGNLEGPITSNRSVSVGSKVGSAPNFQFTFSPKITDALLLNNVGYVNLGNNHILNFGWSGLEQTRNYLDKAGIKYFGEPQKDNATTSSIAYIELPQRKIALIGYNEFWKPVASSTVRQIQDNKAEDNYVVVYTHWGQEYASSSPAEQNLAHEFIDAGADVIIGSHPHVVQEIEVYRDKYIFYSLGNFIFDQWFNEGVMSGLIVKLTFDDQFKDPVVEELAVRLNKDGRTCIQD